MHILLLTSELPSAATRPGGGQLSLRWVKELAGRHTFSLLSPVRPEEMVRLPGLKEIFAEVRTVVVEGGVGPWLARAGSLFSRPHLAAGAASRRLRAALVEMVSSGTYDCVQLDNFAVGQYATALPEEMPRVLFFPDLADEVLRQQVWLARGWKKYYYFRQWQLSRYWEKWYAIWSRNVFVVSLQDQRAVKSWDIGVRTLILPPLFDPRLFELPVKNRGEGKILFFGDFSRLGVIDAILRLKEEIMPRVRRAYPAAICQVTGDNPPERIRRLASEDFLISGKVNRIESDLGAAALLAAPHRVAAGIGLDLVETMAAGCPVVTTRSANAGVGAREGREVLLADRPEDFAAAIVRLLQSPRERERLGQAGREWVREKFDRSQSREQVGEVYRRLAAAG